MKELFRILKIVRHRLKTYTIRIYVWWIAYIPNEVISIALALSSWYYYTVFVSPEEAEAYIGGFLSYIIIGLMLAPLFEMAMRSPEEVMRGLYWGYTSLGGFKIPRWAYYYLAGASRADAFVGSLIFEFLVFLVRLGIYAGLGTAIFGLRLSPDPNLGAAFLFTLLGFLASLAIGFMVANTFWLFLHFREAALNPFVWFLTLLPNVVGGVYFPIEILHPALKAIGRLLPHYYAFDGVRKALLAGNSLAQLRHLLPPLLFYTTLLLPLGILSFKYFERYMVYKAKKI